jgi:hypothetical protein
VKALFGNGVNGWNEDLVNTTFQAFDAEQILKIIVPSNGIEDTLAWHYENNGIFTVKSAYKLATRLNKEDHGASSKNPDGSRSLWQNIWKTNVPNKVRIFSWRLASDNLPTRENKRV